MDRSLIAYCVLCLAACGDDKEPAHPSDDAAVNQPPVANPDSFSTAFNTPLTIAQATLLANDSDPESATITVTGVTADGDGHGTPTLSGTDVVFTPASGFSGTAHFTYTISDGALSASAAVTVTVGAKAAPVAVDDTATLAEGAAATSLDVLANDTDSDGGGKTILSVTQPSHGVVTIIGGGTGLTYAPTAGYCNEAPNDARDAFTYSLAPGSSTATVAIKVTCRCGLLRATDFVVGGN